MMELRITRGYGMVLDEQDRFWISNEKGEISVVDSDMRVTRYPGDAETDLVFVFGVDQQNRVWGTTDEGLYMYTPEGKGTVYKTRNSGLPHSRIHDALLDSQGNVWVATEGGLAVFNPGDLSSSP
jgi:ligand-binding sensor domain-containing protein